jgi:DNA-binding transcriptional LysR family regulator
MDRSGQMIAFVRAVELGGFSPAAREIGLSPSAVSKLVTRLEDRLGVQLMVRTTRRLALTPEGEAFFQRSQRILAEMEEAESEVSQFRRSPRGLLRMHTGVAFGLHQLARVLPEFLDHYPEIRLDLTVTDREVDLVEEGVDLAIRMGPLAESSLHARRICDLERVICAAPRYLKRHGTPRTPDDLARHNCIWITTLPALRRWPFDTPDGQRLVEVSGNVVANNAETMLQLALMGVGIVRLVDALVGEPIGKGELVPILTDCHHVEPVPLYAVYPHGRQRSPKVTAMVNFLVARFRAAPWRQPPAAPAPQ